MKDQSNGLNEENWVVEKLPYTGDVAPRGFLQLCADRRFHRVLQERFQQDAGLSSSLDYWIHADAGGTPKMEDLTIAPDYCYHDKKVRLMGWSAHGDGCGGFGESVPDDVIERALRATAAKKRKIYEDAKHFVYFVTIKKERETEETVVYSRICEKGSD
ncbi:MAG TPA: hypothetical protein VJT09_17535 [Pyrinomonadaceae bacterium]|nr:hypothetical protein [Pyrinomonadaceae bacterium]